MSNAPVGLNLAITALAVLEAHDGKTMMSSGVT
jgi:hypothetical protein